MAATQHQRIILGLKVRQFRQEKGWNFEELSRQSGTSISYLNEIEKGKKYPKPDIISRLADAFGVPLAFLISPELTKQYAPVGDLLQSNFLNELPLELFGIEMQQVVEIIARAPERVNAFISALLEIARNYSLRDENFYFAALRAYQELRNNYFEEIEAAADHFVATHGLPEIGGIGSEHLADLLHSEFGYQIDDKGLNRYPELQHLRSVYNPKKHRLLLNSRLSESQRAFQLAKELGFNILGLKERPLASNFIRVKSFEEALNNYQAAYFAVAILVHRESFIEDLKDFFSQPKWSIQPLLDMALRYQASPEVLFQRFNLLTREVGLEKVFFQRFIHNIEGDTFDIDKELHLNRRHHPHASGLHEHYCRRWLSITLLHDLHHRQATQEHPPQMLVGIQHARFADTAEEYLCIALAKPGYPTRGRNVSVVLGVLLDEHSRAVIRFSDDPAIPRSTVGHTCQRCTLTDCTVRAAPPTVIQQREEKRRVMDLLSRLTGREE